MATIQSQGIGSNLDITGIISKLMDVEKQPVEALDKKRESYETRISAFGSLKSSLATLQNTVAGMVLDEGDDPVDFYSTFKGTLADESIGTLTATQGTQTGTHSLEVENLAKSHRIMSNAGTSFGTGSLTIRLGSEDGSTTSRTTTINLASSDIQSIKDAINSANAGVSAAVVNGTSGMQLVLTGKESGANQFIRLSGSAAGLSFTPGVASPNFTQEQAAQNASIRLDGIQIQSSTNTFTNLLDGVTLEVKKESTAATTMSLTRDTSGLAKLLEKMVSGYNDYVKQSKEFGNYNFQTGESGVLIGDSTLRSTDSRLRTALGSVVSSASFRSLSDIGITMEKDGTLKLDSAKLEKASTQDFSSVAKLASGVGKALEGTLNSLIGSDGSIIAKTSSIENMVKAIDARKAILNSRLEMLEARYTKQFTALDTLISSLMQTSNYLEQQLASLPGVSSSKN